jgi:hypothetical protein
MADNTDERSEYEGGGVMPNTVFPKGTDALTAGDQLRLISITGQEADSKAPVDPWFWQGGDYSSRALDGVETSRRARERSAQQRRREESRRYRESPD